MGIAGRIIGLFQGYNWLIIPAAFFAIVLHEVSHGAVALLLGDTTAKECGRLSLNPIRHLDIFGLLCMIIFGFGWAKPVPVNPRNFKSRKLGMAVVALAGPVSNIILALIAVLLMGITLKFCPNSTVSNLVVNFLYVFALLDIGLAVFNFIPVPPLDGSKILAAFIPDRAYGQILKYERYGMLILFVLINIPEFSSILGYAQRGIFELMLNIAYKIM